MTTGEYDDLITRAKREFAWPTDRGSPKGGYHELGMRLADALERVTRERDALALGSKYTKESGAFARVRDAELMARRALAAAGTLRHEVLQLRSALATAVEQTRRDMANRNVPLGLWLPAARSLLAEKEPT